MTENEEEQFQSSNTCWICEKPIDDDDEKVRDHCHITGKFRGATHWSCNINLQLTKKVPVIFLNLRGYDSHLIFNELKNFDVKVDVIPNTFEKYMAFFLNKNLVFIDSIQSVNAISLTVVQYDIFLKLILNILMNYMHYAMIIC